MSVPESEYGSISKKIHIAASPDVVYEVVSRPEHIAQWWTDDADFVGAPGGTGVLTWNQRAVTKPFQVEITVVEAVPGELFSFRWVYPEGESPTTANSMLVTFALAPDGGGTLLTVTEDGMREQGWEAAVLEEYYTSHDDGWTRHLADLATYAANLAAEGGRR
jgi:uncharacterized protein YndB with AHSA1/START domain